MNFKDTFISLLLFQAFMVALIINEHTAIKDPQLFVFCKLLEIAILLTVPLLVWDRIENPKQIEE